MKRTELLSRLWEIQNNYGYISNKAISEIAQKLNVSKIEIEGVVSFYHFFHLQPTGKHIIYLNNCIVSEFKGFSKVKAAFEKETGCTFGVYNKNPLFSLFETSCIGLSDQEPAALIDFYPFTDLTSEKVKHTITQLKTGIHPKEIANNPKSKIQYTPPEDKTVFFRDYKLGDSLRKLKNQNADLILNEISDAALDGQGGAFFPTAIKWKASKESSTKTKYIICNADEGEPGTFKDKSLLNNLPGLVIEGMIIAAYVIGAKEGFIYLRAEYKYLLKKIKNTIKEFKQNGLLGKNILGSGIDIDIHASLGAGAYICGEETALLESLEGKKGQPRFKPPFPANFGLYGRPTTINNTESFASVPSILRNGGTWFADKGVPNSGGMKCFSVSGHVNNPGNFEIPLGTPFAKLLEMAGGVRNGRGLKAVIPGGCSMPVVHGDVMLETNLDYDSVAKSGSMLGSGAVIVMDDTTCMVKALERLSRFYYSESCGQCTPCREGTGWLYRVVQRIEAGKGEQGDLDKLDDVASKIEGRTICAFGDAAAWPVRSFVKQFRDEFQYHIDHKRCMVGSSKTNSDEAA